MGAPLSIGGSILACSILACSVTSQTRQGSRGVPSTEQILRTMVPDGVEFRPDVRYRQGDSEAWRLDLALPTSRGIGLRPALVFVHGGGWRSGDKRSGYFLQGALDYARLGYVCATVNYRLLDEAPFPACIEDVKCAVRWLRAHAAELRLDPKRIGGYGNSAGAHLVAMLGLAGPEAGLEGDGPWQEYPSTLNAVCAAATPTFPPPRLLERLAPDAESRTRARRWFPVAHARPDAPPFLLIHGTQDRTVAIEHADQLFCALVEAAAKDVDYRFVAGAGHGVFMSHARETHPWMRAFFARTLGGRER